MEVLLSLLGNKSTSTGGINPGNVYNELKVKRFDFDNTNKIPFEVIALTLLTIAAFFAASMMFRK